MNPSTLVQLEDSDPSTFFAEMQEQGISEIPSITLPNSTNNSDKTLSDESSEPSDSSIAQTIPSQDISQEVNSDLIDDLPGNDELKETDSLTVLEGVEPMANNTVSVTSYNDLKNILEGTTTYSEILLASTFTMGGGIAVNAAWKNIVINGKDTPTGITHQITDAGSTTPQGTIYINNTTTQSITFKNVQISGNNTYGTIATSDISNATISFQNVGFTGTKMVHTRFGKVQLLDCRIIIQKNSNTTQTGNSFEVALAFQVEIGGNTIISNSSYTTSYPMFTLADSGSGITVLSGAKVNVKSMNYFVKGSDDGNTFFTIQDTGQFYIDSIRGMTSPNTDYPLGVVTVGRNAVLYIEKTGGQNEPCISVKNSLFADDSSTLVLRQSVNKLGAAIFFTTTGAELTLNNPRKTLLQSSSGIGSVQYTGTVTISTTAMAINTWSSSPGTVSDDFTTMPENIWCQQNATNFTVRTVLGDNQQVTDFATSWIGKTTQWNDLLSATTYNPATLNTIVYGNYKLDIPNGIEKKSSTITGIADPNAKLRIYKTTTPYTGQADTSGNFSIDSDFSTVAVGTQIPVLSSHDQIKAIKIFPVVHDGELKFGIVPSTLSFSVGAIPAEPMYIPRQETDWSLSIEDTRGEGSNWRLDASIYENQLTDGNDHYLDGSINYVLGDSSTPLSTVPLTIASKTTGTNSTTTFSWNKNQGLLIWLNSISTILPNIQYSATIQWTLIDSP